LKTILFVVQNLNVGGVQKAFVNTANYLSNKGYDIRVFAFNDGILRNELNTSIKVRYGGKLLRLMLTSINDVKQSHNIIDLILRYGMILFAKIFGVKKLYYWLFNSGKDENTYDISVSYFNDVTTGFSNRGTNWYVADFVSSNKKIAWIHTDPEKANFDRNQCLELYSKFSSIVCVSEAVKNKMIKLLPEYKEKMCVIYNYFPEDIIRKKAMETLSVDEFNPKQFNIVTVGRVENTSKRMDRIVKICKKLKEKNIKDFKWYIVGDGPDEKMIKELVNKENLNRFIRFTGRLNNPYVLLKQSDLFVLTSAYEGYPMVIGEALLLGVPVVTTDFAASSEMIIDGENGFVCEMNEEEICTKIEHLMKDKSIYSMIKSNVLNTKYVNTKWEEQISIVFNR